ncbi:GIY-YIG catalytic domain-containing endonuclease [Faustovirus]|nr:GIY-YIG catalytic domain-containing endonuclease [Faustovirus]QJX72977.1 GIY-YIG catalytic domain-containing endonuclease [Faustovirus]QJX73482.1 GIY-YIG catalytic domain-containing endonuclease [Faustovirus]
MGFIYKITCSVSNKIYIGQTTYPISERWSGHKSSAKKFIKNRNLQDYTSCNHLYNAVNKYGISKFKIEPIEEIPDDQLNDREKYWISHFDTIKNGYNIKEGGDNGKHTDDVKKLISKRVKEAIANNISCVRKHKDILNGLPIGCSYCIINTKPCIVVKNDVCKYKMFEIAKFDSLDAAKKYIIEFIDNLRSEGKKYIKNKKGDDLPKHIRVFKNGYVVTKITNGIKKSKKFMSKKLSPDQNLENAKKYLESLI